MKHLKLFEEIKYTTEHKKLVAQLRYYLNKYFGQNCCGVSKVRTVIKRSYTTFGNGVSTKWEPYTGSTMLFRVYVPSFIGGANIPNYYDKIKTLKELLKEIGIPMIDNDVYTIDDIEIKEDQMKELISRMKYIEDYMIAKKYNL